MKILHTSDWHLGKQLQKIDFEEDMELFFEWLLSTIKAEKIDILLMSGDLFDHANPSQSALNQYYRFLKKSIPTQCKLIITGGNHDSAAVLNAPKDILQLLDITIVGGATERIEDSFITLTKNDETVIIAAIPFLKEKDIRQASAGESYADKIEKIKSGLANYYKKVNEHFTENYQDNLFIVMGHLFVQGSTVSESEREIQIGNQAAVDASIFGSIPNYVALGHIHKPQRIGGAEHIRYCGSPIPLSFSERDDVKQVVVLDTSTSKEITIAPLHIPVFRKLVSISGTYEEVLEKLNQTNEATVLPTLVELIIEEEHHSIATIQKVNELIMEQPYTHLKIVKHKVIFANQLNKTGQLLEPTAQLADFTPTQLFEKRLDAEPDIVNKEELIYAFKEILETIHHQQ
jgi:DNA repair protein SbcD/Mre11